MTTQPPDFRALCAELIDAHDSYMMMDANDESPMSVRTVRLMNAVRDCKAALSTPPLAPIPVSEGLPGAKECDAKGRCWLSNSDTPYGWILDNPEQCTNYTHWLPHWAIPLPEVKE
jgi:hypothetical protein